MSIFEVNSPEELRKLPEKDLPGVAAELRETIISSVARNGGHLASSLGTVELIVALHRVFDTPREKIFFDVGHQAYAHKLLTGRRSGFADLRKAEGVSGFPTPLESEFDPAVSGHAGTALSAALGAAAAQAENGSKVIAVVGDGASGCGVTFEALNCAAECIGSKKLIVILNDNQMSISRNVGALTGHLSQLLSGNLYNRMRNSFKRVLQSAPRLTRFFRHLNDVLKSAIMPPGMFFEALGFRYFGPASGHDLPALIRILKKIRRLDGPVLLHVVTEKGHGCEFACKDPTTYHGIPGCDEKSGALPAAVPGYSQAFSKAMLKLAAENKDLVAVSAAMLSGTGLAEFAEKYPERTFDAGIAEEHAVTFAAGMASAGKRPVCAIYDTFLQRALDAVYHDAALANLPLIIVADRAGAVEDGPTHHGIYSCGFLRALPNITILSPARCTDVETCLRFALQLAAPVIIRYPRGAGADIPAGKPLVLGKAEILRRGKEHAPVLWSVGAEAGTALKTAELLAEQGMECTVADARFLKPFDTELARSFAGQRHYTIEDHSVCGGLYSALLEALAGMPHREIHPFGWDDKSVIGHGKPGILRQKSGMTAEMIAEKILRLEKMLRKK